MAPKRAAKKAAAPPPPPPPPAESSDETRSGSRSRSDDSEDEEAIADSPVPAPTPTLKNAPAPSQKGGESESSEEEEDDDDDDDGEEEPVRAPPKNQPPPPQKKEDSETSGDEDDDDEEEEEEPTRPAAAPPSAPKKQPPQPQKKEDSDTSGDEGESDDDEEAPPPKQAPKKEAEALKPPAAAAADTKKPGAAQRIWSTDDEVRILEAVAAHQKQHGTFPQPDALVDVLAGKLDNPAYGSKELHSKVRSLRTRYLTLSKRGELPSKEHDRRLLDLCKMVWDSDKTTPAAAAAANGHERKGFEEMCELYPYLAEEVKELEAARPGMCKREFGKMDDEKARAMDEKIKRQRVAQIKLEMRLSDLAKEVTKALIDLVDG